MAVRAPSVLLRGLGGLLAARWRLRPHGGAGLLRQQHGLDVGQDASLGDRHAAQQLVELLVVADGQLQVAGDYPRLLVVAGRIARQLQDLSGEVLEYRRQVDRRAGAHPLGVVALPQQPVHAAHGKLKACSRRARLGLGAGLAAGLAAARHAV